jgi:hypothetical protein
MNGRLKEIYDELYEIIAARSGEYGRAAKDQCAVWEGRPGEQPLLFAGAPPEKAGEVKAAWKKACAECGSPKTTSIIEG